MKNKTVLLQNFIVPHVLYSYASLNTLFVSNEEQLEV